MFLATTAKGYMITKELLEQKIQEYKEAAQRLNDDSKANLGAAWALEQLLSELEETKQE